MPAIPGTATATRARTRSAKISAAWNADAADAPYRRAYSWVNCAGQPLGVACWRLALAGRVERHLQAGA